MRNSISTREMNFETVTVINSVGFFFHLDTFLMNIYFIFIFQKAVGCLSHNW